MFSAVYLVCFIGEPCKMFVDPYPYPTVEECTGGAEKNIEIQQLRVQSGEIAEFDVDYQCVGWGEA